MRTRTCPTAEREGIRVVPRGQKWCRPQPVGKNTAPLGAENRPSVFERHFGPFASGVVLVWVFIRVFDFTLIPPARLARKIPGRPCVPGMILEEPGTSGFLRKHWNYGFAFCISSEPSVPGSSLLPGT
jgi:hypothetical protein